MSRYAALDGLRGLAILMVMVFHFHLPVPGPKWLIDPLLHLEASGSNGVNLFFVLSGFLITGILWDTRTETHYLRNFFARRFLRIFPLYYGTLFVLLVLIPHLHPIRDPKFQSTVHHQIWLWLYASNIYETYSGRALPLLGHFWSLAVEEHFYLVWPFVVWWSSRRVFQGICWGCFLVAFLTRWALLHAGADPAIAVVRLTPCQIDSLAAGAFLAVLMRPAHQDRLPVSRHLVTRFFLISATIFLILCLAPSFFMKSSFAFASYGSFTAVFFGASVLLALISPAGAPFRRTLEARPLRLLGKYSYALYVFHWPIGRLCDQLFPRWWHLGAAPLVYPWSFQAAYFVAAFSLSLFAAWLSWNLYEKHFLKLKKIFDYHHRSTLVRAAGT
jgi:peptidoglycan/LPS O-acetylase OafA/YrhL